MGTAGATTRSAPSVRRPGGGQAHGRRGRGGDRRGGRGGNRRGRRGGNRRWGPGFRRGRAGGGRWTASLVAGTGSLGLAGSSLHRRYTGRQRRDDTQWPTRAAGQPASGRRHGDGDDGARAGLHRARRCGLPQPQRHPRRRHRHRRGRDQQPWRQQPPEPVPPGRVPAGRGPAGRGPAGRGPAGRGRRGDEPVAERIRLVGRPPPAGIGIGRGHGRGGPEPHGSASNPRRARPAGSPS